MEKPDNIIISVVIPTADNARLLEGLLESLHIQGIEPEQWEIWIVDGSKDKQTEQLISDAKKKFNRLPLKYIHYPSKGMLQRRNEGIRRAAGKYLILLDDDVIMHVDYMKNALEELPKIKGIFAGGGKILPMFEQQKPPWLNKFFMPLLAEVNLGEKIRLFPKNKYPFGINMIFRREVFERYGLFPEEEDPRDEDWINMSERTYLRRLRREGVPLYYFPDLMVWHLLSERYLDKAYIRRQAQIHYQMKLNEWAEAHRAVRLRLLVKELLKWAGTLGVAVYYLFSTQWEKIKPLFWYRYWGTKILLKYLWGHKEITSVQHAKSKRL